MAASSGNLVEWYDFYAYAFTSIYFAAAFFPSGDQTSQLLATAGIFAVGFFMRPLGGWLFGWIADAHGRKNSMVLSVLLMCAGSLMIGILPTYQTIGAAAPALLLFARMAQGLSVGGEYGTAATYMSEIAGKGNRGFYSSFQYVTLVGGQLLALLVVVVLQQTLSLDELKEWGWRVPFLFGAVAAIVALYLRRSLQETASAETMHNKEAGSLSGLLHHKRALLIVLAFTIGGSLYFYTFTTYMQKFLVNSVKMDAKTVSSIMTAVLIAFMLLQPVFGALSDRIGRRNNMILFQRVRNFRSGPALDDIVQHHQRLRRFWPDHDRSRDCVFLYLDQWRREGRTVSAGGARAGGRASLRHRQCDVRRNRGICCVVAEIIRIRNCILLVRRGDGALSPSSRRFGCRIHGREAISKAMAGSELNTVSVVQA